MNYRNISTTRGFSFVELLVTSVVIVLVFGGLTVTFQSMISLIGNSKLKAGAISIANERIEYIRSLSYNSVGTVSGIPEGLIEQNSTSTLNDVTYTERTVIQYVDAPEDGVGALDSNGILADYKRVKIEISWKIKGVTKYTSIVTNIIPRGIESTTGGGTLTINVFDATAQPVQSANVHIYNNTTTTTIDTSVFTNLNGVATFPGAPAAANYQIDVSKSSYSNDQTYSASTTNPNPNPAHVAVIESYVSTVNFIIDKLSNLSVKTIGVPTIGQVVDDFDNTNFISSSTNTTVSGGSLLLSGGAGTYSPSGSVWGASTTPSSFNSWEALSVSASSSSSTTVKFYIYSVTGTSTYALVPDADLLGNSLGFSYGVIDISSLNISTYPTLASGAVLSTADSNVTPQILEWTLSYIVSEPPIGNIDFVLTGNKNIGSTASGMPVYKYKKTHSTDALGNLNIINLEWDTYDIALSGGSYDIAEACGNIPYALNPNVNDALKLTLISNVTDTFRVRVENISGSPIGGANIDLTRTGFSDSGTSSVCGQYFFNSGLVPNSDYQLDVSASGYVSETITTINISGDTNIVVVLGV